MKWTISAVPASGLPALWSTVAPLLAPAIRHSNGRHSMRTLFEDLASGRKLLWVAYDEAPQIGAAFTTRVAVYPLKSMLALDFIGGGDMLEWVFDLRDVLGRYAADAGLAGIETCGRLGWDRLMRQNGWQRIGMMHEWNGS